MDKEGYIFGELVKLVEGSKLNGMVRKYEGDKYMKRYRCWNEVVRMMLGEVWNGDSVRDLIVGMEGDGGKV